MAAALLMALGGFAVPAAAQNGAESTSVETIEEEAEATREKAESLKRRAAALAEEMRAIKAKSVTVARKAQALESQLSEIEATFATLREREAEKRAALKARRGQLAQTLSALQRIAVQPPEALAFGEDSPLDVVRGAMLLGVAVPEIEQRAAQLRGELADLRRLRRQLDHERERMAATKARLGEERAEVARLLARKQRLREQLIGRSRAAEKRASRLAEQAADMRDLVAKLRSMPIPKVPESAPQPDRKPEPEPVPEAARQATAPNAEKPREADAEGGAGTGADRPADTRTPTPSPTTSRKTAAEDTQPSQPTGRAGAPLSQPDDIRPFPDRRASLRMPARGDIVTRYGERITLAGGTSNAKGIVIATRPEAQVVAPYDGQVVYAGPFKGYGRILIIEHGSRYHTLLAGLERIDAIVGQWVLAGEPVGVMGNAPTRTPELYVELRRTGRPINPLPWLAQIDDKVRG